MDCFREAGGNQGYKYAYYCRKKFVNDVQQGIKDTDKPYYSIKNFVNNVQQGIKDTDKPYYCIKKFVNNVQEAIKDIDKPCCCCKKHVNNVNNLTKLNSIFVDYVKLKIIAAKSVRKNIGQTTKIYVSLWQF